MAEAREHAVVIGGSIAGLCAAHVLSSHYARVTLLERDRLDDSPGAPVRRGIPQAKHVHGLLALGSVVLEELFPGLDAELAGAGAPQIEMGREIGYLGVYGWSPGFEPTVPIRCPSRLLLEASLRRRVRASGRVQIREEQDVAGLLSDQAKQRVTGVRLAGGETVEASLVVDATGRGSRAGAWLEALGRAAPRESVVDAFIGYATRLYRDLPPFPPPWRALYLMWKPGTTRGGVILPVEDGIFVVTLAGAARDYPPTDEAGFFEYARSLRSPLVAEAIQAGRPAGDIHGSRTSANRWRHYEALKDQPPGFLVTGDAACSFNPVYGQGMTMGAVGAQILGELFSAGQSPDLKPALFQRALAARLKTVWSMSTSEDFRFPTTEGVAPFTTRLAHRYLDAVLKAATRDQSVTRTIARVLQLLDPPTDLFRPRVLLQALTGGRLRSFF
jgi:2-polyprenyl-6-methoxyphenol hydroxylase-like FAD-dependent oxidoreductase